MSCYVLIDLDLSYKNKSDEFKNKLKEFFDEFNIKLCDDDIYLDLDEYYFELSYDDEIRLVKLLKGNVEGYLNIKPECEELPVKYIFKGDKVYQVEYVEKLKEVCFKWI